MLAVVPAVGAGVTGRLVRQQDLPTVPPVTTLPPLPDQGLRADWPAPPA